MTARVAPYGTWDSALSATAIAAGGLRLSGIAVDGEDIYWIEGRPAEGGRNVLMRRSAEGRIADATPAGVNVRTRVHEYGAGAYAVADGTAYYVNFADQRLYRTDSTEPLTAPGYFYADFEVDRRRGRLIAVREDHTQGGEPINTLVSIPLGGSKDPPYGTDDLGGSKDPPYGARRLGPSGPGEVIASGYDFYSSPRLSPDGSRLVWLSWRHPQMPWDGTELWVADISGDGTLARARLVAGGESESIYQPGWSPDGRLYFASDRTGWWSLYRSNVSNDPNDPNDPNDGEAVLPHPPSDAEFGRPQWAIGTATWAFAGPSRIVVSYTRSGRWHLATIDVPSGRLTDLPGDWQPHEWLTASGAHAVLVAGSSDRPDAVIRVALASGEAETIRASSTVQLDPGDISAATAIEFPTTNGQTAHAFYYAPRSSTCRALPGERPPLIIITHGGPTTAARATFDPQVQFWTTRGFAVADVNYGGSSGFGRAYRQRLNGQWGIVDVADVVNAARFLCGQSPNSRRGGPSGPPDADPARLAIRGGSAGGYTTLAALTFYPGVFAAGASYYGVSDIELLARDTHKFESRYLEMLVGPYPARQDLYRERSPIHFVDRLASPLILFQGLDDKVVPPNQSQKMADAVRAKGLPVVYLAFAGEQHGFRKAETIVRCLEEELAFYRRVFGITGHGDTEARSS